MAITSLAGTGWQLNSTIDYAGFIEDFVVILAYGRVESDGIDYQLSTMGYSPELGVDLIWCNANGEETQIAYAAPNALTPEGWYAINLNTQAFAPCSPPEVFFNYDYLPRAAVIEWMQNNATMLYEPTTRLAIEADLLSDIGRAINEKIYPDDESAYAAYSPAEMPYAIRSITGVLGVGSFDDNGTYDAEDEGYDGYSTVFVSVRPKLQSKTVRANETVTADSGYDGLSSVTVAIPYYEGW